MRMISPADAHGLYDALIVGAGPAGATAAYFLGAAGRRVLVLEKARLPRYKACGGGLSARFLAQVFPFSFEPVLQTQVEAFEYAFGGRTQRIPVRPGAVGFVMRERLDRFILEQAQVDVLEGAAVTGVREEAERVCVETRGGSFYGRYLIGADGANSVVARSLGLRRGRQLAAAIEVEVRPPPEVMRRFAHTPVFIMGEIGMGYLWIFPKPDHLSVGIAAFHPKPGALQATLEQVMARYGIALDLSGSTPGHGHPIPLYSGREPIATPRVLLAGDAAGLADPFSGEGIRYGIKSGRIAAEAILRGRPEDYARAIFRQIGFQHSLSVPLAFVFYRLERLCLRLGAPNPFTTAAIVEMLSDRISPLQVALRSFATLPLFALTELAAWTLARARGESAANRLRARVYPKTLDYGGSNFNGFTNE